MAKTKLQKKTPFTGNYQTKMRLRILNAYVLSVLTYRSKMWISTGDEAHKKAAEMRFLRRMLRIPWRDNESNNNVLNRALVLRNIC